MPDAAERPAEPGAGVDWRDRAIRAEAHIAIVDAKLAALEAENARLTGEVRGLVARVHATDHDVIDGEWTDCPFDACTNARAALARPGGEG